MSIPATPANKQPPENLLFRSHLEISRILRLLAQEHCRITSELKDGHPFSSFLLFADAERFAISYCVNKTINTMLLQSPSVEFTVADQRGLHYSFEASAPEETQFRDQPAIQFALPHVLLMHNRREHPRIPIPDDISLRCIADENGFIPFEAHITDVSHDGLGCLIYEHDVKLEPGTVLKTNRIILPNGHAVIVDLELRYATTITLADGTVANRAGFRLVQKPDKVAELLGYFIQDLDKK